MKLPIIKTLSEGFKIIKKNPIILLPPLIGSLLSFVVQIISFGSPTYNISSVLITLLINLANIFLFAMSIRMAYDAVKRKKVSLESAAKITANRFLPIVLATILMGAITAGGFLLLIIPGVFLLVKLFFYEFAILIDNAGVRDSLKKSWRVTKGNWWRIFGLLLLMGVAYLPLGILNLILLAFAPILSLLMSAVLAPLLTAWYTVSLTVAYTKLRK